MKIQFTYSPALFALACLSSTSAAFAAPTEALLPSSQASVLTQTQTAKVPVVLALAPAAVPIKGIVPIAASAPTAKAHVSAKRGSDYRYSNPSRWHSDMTTNSIRNQ